MKLYTPNNHIVVEIADHFYLVDTGSPVSFTYLADRSIRLDGAEYMLSQMPICPKEMADRLTGMDISGFIGMDIIAENGLSIDYEQGRLEFKVTEEIGTSFTMPVSSFAKMFICMDTISIGDKMGLTIIDTGACISYLSREHLSGLVETDEDYHDDNPASGAIEGHFFLGEISFDGDVEGRYTHAVKVGELPAVFEMIGADAVIGPHTLSDKAVVIDLENSRIGIR